MSSVRIERPLSFGSRRCGIYVLQFQRLRWPQINIFHELNYWPYAALSLPIAPIKRLDSINIWPKGTTKSRGVCVCLAFVCIVHTYTRTYEHRKQWDAPSQPSLFSGLGSCSKMTIRAYCLVHGMHRARLCSHNGQNVWILHGRLESMAKWKRLSAATWKQKWNSAAAASGIKCRMAKLCRKPHMLFRLINFDRD